MKAVTIAAEYPGPSKRFYLWKETPEAFVGWPADRPFVLKPIAYSKVSWRVLRVGEGGE